MSFVETHAFDGGIVEIKLARAPVNALDPALCTQLRQALRAAVDSGARGIVLSGGEKVFSAGLDVPHLLSLGEDREALKAAWQSFFDTALALAESPVPVAVAMAGHAPAGGCVLALCCDYRVMAEGAFKIGLNEVQVGLCPGPVIYAVLRRMVGPRHADQLISSGLLLSPAQALEVGLVDRVGDQARGVLVLEPVEDPLSLLAGRDDAGEPELGEVLGHGRRGLVDDVGEVVHRELSRVLQREDDGARDEGQHGELAARGTVTLIELGAQ